MLIHRERGSASSISESTDGADVSYSEEIVGETFKVLGSAGNVYTVTIDNRPRCDCPDAVKNTSQICKHLIFVFLKVLKIPQSDYTWYQKALTRAEVLDIFQKAKPDPTLTNASLQSIYLVATGQKEASSAEEPESSTSKRRRNVPSGNDGSCCPICYEEFQLSEVDDLIYCQASCGNPVHQMCLEAWTRSCEVSQATCVWCRATFADDKDISASSPRQVVENGRVYLNLGGTSAGISVERDYSIYSRHALLAMYQRGTLSQTDLRRWSHE